jgi:DNA primase
VPAKGSPSAQTPETPEWREQLRSALPIEEAPRGVSYLSGRGLSRALAIGNDVAYSPSWYGRPALLFPLINLAGAVVAMQGRYIDGGDKPKARTAGELKQGIFKTLEALDVGTLVITEAPIDALSLAAVGVPAIALCGTNAPSWLPQAAAFKRVGLAFDADDAGDQAAEKLVPLLRSFGAEPERWRPPRKDWNAVLLEDGADALRRWLAGQSAS